MAFGQLLPWLRGQAGIVILVAREPDTQMICAVQVPEKGQQDSISQERVLVFLRERVYEFCTVFLR